MECADGEPFAMAADEYYLLAGREVPGRKAYGSFAQIENGVGLLRRFRDDAAVPLPEETMAAAGAAGGTVVTGRSASRIVPDSFGNSPAGRARGSVAVPVTNRLMGESVTVTGLLGGNDIAVRGRPGRSAGRCTSRRSRFGTRATSSWTGSLPEDVSRRAGARGRVFEPTPRGFHDAVYHGNDSGNH